MTLDTSQNICSVALTPHDEDATSMHVNIQARVVFSSDQDTMSPLPFQSQNKIFASAPPLPPQSGFRPLQIETPATLPLPLRPDFYPPEKRPIYDRRSLLIFASGLGCLSVGLGVGLGVGLPMVNRALHDCAISYCTKHDFSGGFDACVEHYRGRPPNQYGYFCQSADAAYAVLIVPIVLLGLASIACVVVASAIGFRRA